MVRTALRHPLPGGHDLNGNAILDEVVGLVQRHHDSAPSAAQPRTFYGAPQLPGAISRSQLEAHLDGGVGGRTGWCSSMPTAWWCGSRI